MLYAWGVVLFLHTAHGAVAYYCMYNTYPTSKSVAAYDVTSFTISLMNNMSSIV